MHFLATLLLIALVALVAFAGFTWLVARKLESAFPPTGRWIEVEGERLHYRDLGQGPPIVLVHGLAGESRNFDYLPLQDLAQRWRLVLVDRPGSGHSPRRDDGKAPSPRRRASSRPSSGRCASSDRRCWSGIRSAARSRCRWRCRTRRASRGWA